MKIIVLGLGSIGKRHLSNLRALRPGVRVVGADPVALFELASGDAMFADWREALAANSDADAAIIASPTAAHLEQAIALRAAGIPFYCEKPIGLPDELAQWRRLDNGLRCAVGYQYRFHRVYTEAAGLIRSNGYVKFYARDNLLARYGHDCMGAIAAHPIDTALWLLGDAMSVDVQTDGLGATGIIWHDNGISEHDYRIDEGPRASMVSTLGVDGRVPPRTAGEGGHDGWSLDADNGMYVDALSAWLKWIEGGECDGHTATLADGCAALEVMGQVKHV